MDPSLESCRYTQGDPIQLGRSDTIVGEVQLLLGLETPPEVFEGATFGLENGWPVFFQTTKRDAN